MSTPGLLVGILALAVLLALARTWWVNVRRRFARVADGVYRSGAMTPRKLAATVRRHGVRTVIDFRRDLALVAAEREQLAGLGVRHVHLVSPQRPDPDVVKRFLETMAHVERPVLLHCTHGTGRTPVFAAVYLMEAEGWPERRALRRAFWPALNGARKIARLRHDRERRRPARGADVGDLDAMEERMRRRRRRRGLRGLLTRRGPGDPPDWRGLLAFARPYAGAIALAAALAGVAAAAKVAWAFALKLLLEPALPSGPAASLASSAGRALPDLLRTGGGFFDAMAASAAMLAGAVRWAWGALPAERQLAGAAAAMLAVVVVEQAAHYGQRLLVRTAALDIMKDMRAAVFDRLLALSLRFHQANHSGRLLARMTHDLSHIGSLMIYLLVDLMADVQVLVAALLCLWALGGGYVVVGLGIAAMTFVPIQQLGRRIKKREGANQKRMGALYVVLSEVLGAAKVVKVFGAEEHERRRLARANDENAAGQKASAGLAARVQPLVEVVGILGLAAFIVYGGHQVLGGSWSRTDLIAVTVLLAQCISAMRRLGDTSAKVYAGLSSADRVATVLDARSEVVDAPDAVELRGLQHGLAFRGVGHDHHPGQPVLHDVSFELPRGRTLAVVGPTGGGKTTLVDLVPRLFDPSSGAVEIDGLDVRRVTLASLRRQIAVVTQDTVLFADTVAGNIAYARPGTSREEIERVARAASAHDFIVRLPKGYDTGIGERGMRLSGGERQRIAIARALLKDAPILILDEATSALDTASEAIVQQAIETLMAGRTTLVIAHRLSTVRNADIILVLDRGRVVGRGTHEELLRQRGLYSRLWRLQAAGDDTGLVRPGVALPERPAVALRPSPPPP